MAWLSRAACGGRAVAPVRIVHLGLGSFFRAHPCWYTDHAPDAEHWGIAAFTGRGSRSLVDALNAQDGLYTLVSRGSEADEAEVISCLSAAHQAADHEGWLRFFASPDLTVVTVTVTEAGWLRGAGGGLDTRHPVVATDIEALRASPTAMVRSAPARLVAGLAARRRADGGPLAVVPCDNVPENGAMAARVLTDLAALADPHLAAWLEESVSVVTTVVDRITPRPGPCRPAAGLQHCGPTAGPWPSGSRAAGVPAGVRDRCPVVTEPYSEWVLSGAFPAGRPRWDESGALLTADPVPYERRKLWLLNGAHSLLAYAGSIRGHATVGQAAADDICRSWLDDWWEVAASHLDRPAAETVRYRRALLARFGNSRINDQLARIAADGSQKLPVRILPVLRAERAAGRLPAAATRTLAAWVCHLRGRGAPVSDVLAGDLLPLARGPLPAAVPRLLARLDPGLGADADVAAIVAEQAGELTRSPSPRGT